MRVIGWETKLTDYLREVSRDYSAIKYSEMDCGIFVAGAASIITGCDYLTPLRGAYTSFDGAIDFFNSLGFPDHIAYVASLFELRPSRLMAMPGDIAVFEDASNMPALGIVQGERIYCLGETDLRTVRIEHANKVFAV